MFRTSVCVCVLFLLACSVLPMAAQQGQPQVVTYYAFINNSTGAIRIVSKTTVCKSTEHKINWNQVGPQGPKGPQGPQGAQGPQGPQGPPGMSLGYSALVPPNTRIPINSGQPGNLIAQTNPVGTSGTYFISAQVLAFVAPGDSFVFCFDALASTGTASQYSGNYGSVSYVPASISDVLFVNAGDSVELRCYDAGANGSYAYNAGITATLINSSDKASERQPQNPNKTPEQVKSH